VSSPKGTFQAGAADEREMNDQRINRRKEKKSTRKYWILAGKVLQHIDVKCWQESVMKSTLCQRGRRRKPILAAGSPQLPRKSNGGQGHRSGGAKQQSKMGAIKGVSSQI